MTVEFKNLKNFSILVQDFTKFNIRVILNDLGKHQFYNKTAMSTFWENLATYLRQHLVTLAVS